MVVQFARTIEAEADIEILFAEKFAPLVVDRRAVGLNTIDDLFILRQVFFLQFDGFAEEIDAKQRRLAAVPREADDFSGRRLDMLDDVAFESFVVQAKVAALGIEILFL